MTSSDSSQEPRAIALIGYRGCGKSTVGRILATLLGGNYVDTDKMIAERAGKSIAAVFRDEGEDAFRRREREAIGRLVSSPPAVISVGGGAIIDDRNVEVLKSVATLVWLTAPADALWERITADPCTSDTRPSLTARSGVDEVRHLLAQRTPYYERAADLVIDTTQAGPREIAFEIAGRLGRAIQT